MEIVRAYEDKGYHYFALSEHDRLLKPEQLQPLTALCILPAIEVTSRFGQTLLYLGADRELPASKLTPKEIMEHIHAAGGLFIFDHPNWKPRPDYATDVLLDTMEGMRGIEIYTGVIERLPGEAQATDRWDRLLSKGWHVFGHGTDDQHQPDDYFVAWNCVQWPEGEQITSEGIIEALTTGRFYASNGVTIQRVGTSEDGQRVLVECDADAIHWITREGRIMKKESGGQGSFSTNEFAQLLDRSIEGPEQAIYLRVECLGHGNAAAWTQPFWVVE